MPVGKEIGKYKGTFSYVRLCERNGSEEVVEGSYKAKVSGELNGTAVVESFFGLLKRERVNRVRYRTRDEARADVFKAKVDYIENAAMAISVTSARRLSKSRHAVFTKLSIKLGQNQTTLCGHPRPKLEMSVVSFKYVSSLPRIRFHTLATKLRYLLSACPNRRSLG